MIKEEIFTNHLNTRYPNISEIIHSDVYSDLDLVDYIKFQDSCLPANRKGFDNWEKRRQMIDKIKRVGINGVLYRSDVQRTERAVEVRDGVTTKYIVIITDYGDLWVADGKHVTFITYR